MRRHQQHIWQALAGHVYEGEESGIIMSKRVVARGGHLALSPAVRHVAILPFWHVSAKLALRNREPALRVSSAIRISLCNIIEENAVR